MTRTLYSAQRSPYTRKVRIILAEKNLNYELQEVDLAKRSPEFYQLSPIGKVPVFVDGDGTVLWDSTAIVEYLDEVYPEPKFYPDSIKWECRKWEDLADTIADRAVDLWIENRKAEVSNSNCDRLHMIIDRLLAACQQKLSTNSYLIGADWTIADVAVLSSLGYLSLRNGEDWRNKYPSLSHWYEALHQHQSVQMTIPIA